MGLLIEALLAGLCAAGLAFFVWWLVWLRSLGLLSCCVVIADLDLTAQGREVALRLALRWPEVVLWPAGDLPDYIKHI